MNVEKCWVHIYSGIKGSKEEDICAKDAIAAFLKSIVSAKDYYILLFIYCYKTI